MTNTCKLFTIKEVTTAIDSLGLKADQPSLAAISRHCKTEFLDCLSRCVQKTDQDGRYKAFIQGFLKALDSQTLAQLQEVVPEATIDTITIAAMKGPVRLLTALVAARDNSNPRHIEAVTFLNEHTKPTDTSASEQTTSQHTNIVRTDPVASTPSANDTGQQKKHDSYHVYGSSFCICFNASEWNSVPGIMVDAAVANGLKSYDWKTAIHIWLSPVEIAAAIAVFRRWRKEAKFDAHGAQNDKTFVLEYQGSHFFAKVMAKVDSGKVRAVKIKSVDATGVSILFLKQLSEAYKGIPISELLATVRATHQLENAA